MSKTQKALKKFEKQLASNVSHGFGAFMRRTGGFFVKIFKVFDNKLTIQYKQGTAIIHSSICRRTPCSLVIVFEKGIILSRCFWTGKKMYLWKYPFSIKRMVFPQIQNGYEYEFLEMVQLMDENKTESDTIPYNETMRNMYIVDNARKQLSYNIDI